MVRLLIAAGMLALGACGTESDQRQANAVANAQTDVDVLPADESAATSSEDLAEGAVEPSPETNSGTP